MKDLITQMYLICYIHCCQEKTGSRALGLKVLNISFLTKSELRKWLEQVSNYTEEIIQKLCRREANEDENFVACVLQYLNVTQNGNHTEAVFKDINITQEIALTSSVEAIHTGSVPEQYGKPTSAMKDLEPLVRDTFQEVESDHDLMVELSKYPIHFITREEMNSKEKNGLASDVMITLDILEKVQKRQSGSWVVQFFVVPISDDSEFVDLYIEVSFCVLKPHHSESQSEGFLVKLRQFTYQVPNTLARNYLKTLFVLPFISCPCLNFTKHDLTK